MGTHAALTLCGQGQTADDVLTRDAWFVRNELGRNVFVVTNDLGLISRVRRHRCAAGGSVQVLSAMAFAGLLGGAERGVHHEEREVLRKVAAVLRHLGRMQHFT